VGTSARDVVGQIVDENKAPINLHDGVAYLRGTSADLSGVYINTPCVVTDDASGTVTMHEVGMLLTAAQLGALPQATFRCKFFYEDVASATDYSDEFDIVFLAPPIPTFTLTATHTAGGDHEVTLSPAGGSYLAMTVVTVTASGSTFTAWAGADAASLSVATSPATITMSKDMVISATFE
jgi:hypothetical protein